MFFYPTLTEELKEASGISMTPYTYSYSVEENEQFLLGKGKNTVKFNDENWKVERDGIRLRRTVSFEYPEMLFGKDGVACTGAELGICITWVNRSLKMMGTILPESEYMNGAKRVYIFDYEFGPGMIQGDLELDMILYIKHAAETCPDEEEYLINEEGVTVGVLDEKHLDFGNIYMDFPIQEVNDKKQPLWWLDIGLWLDPASELFNEDNLCIYLNRAYDSCPKLGESIKNMDVLVDIITTAYMLIFRRIDELGYLSRTCNDVDLEPGSISKIMYYFLNGCDYPVDFSSMERLHKSLWLNVAEMINKGEEE